MASHFERSEALHLLSAQSMADDEYQIGSWVKVTEGTHKDQVGYVTRIEVGGNLHVLVKDKSQHISAPGASYQDTDLNKARSSSTEVNSFPFLVLPLRPVFHVTRAHPTLNDILPFYYGGIDIEPFTNRRLTQSEDLLLITSGIFISHTAIAKGVTSHNVYALVTDLSNPSKKWKTSLNFNQFQRIFSQGDDVTIEAGPHFGKRGFILDIVENDALILCGNLSAEVRITFPQLLLLTIRFPCA